MEVTTPRTKTRRMVGRNSLDSTKSASGLRFAILPLLLLLNSFTSLAAAQQTQTTPIPVVGVKTGVDTNTGQRPTRRNINDLYARGGPQWDLYILALSEMQAMDESDELSYFSVAGVHGLPHKVWNGVEQVDGAPDSGYCPHGETIFAPWHRPYVALFEQTLVSHAINIASRYPASLQSAYIDAARTLRVPFWDWASDSSLPYAVMNETIKVGNTPNSSFSSLSPPNSNGTGGGSGAPSGAVGVTVRNPLYSYRFHEGSVMYRWGQDHMKLNPQTERCATDNKGENGTATKRWSEPWKAQEPMRELGSQLRDSVYDLFVRPDPEQWGAGGFESPHNAVHNNAGCREGSTMANVDWSAFDPIFMLHHTNTDRLVALWQAIYYKNATFTTASPSGGQLGTKPGTNLTPDSPLKPFHAELPANTSSGNTPPSDAGGYFHTSSSVADLRTFGYTYPELNTDWMMGDKETLAAHVRKAVNKLYGNNDDGSADEQGQGGSSKRDVDDEDATHNTSDGGMHVEENNKITFRRSRLQPRSLSLSTSTGKKINDDTKTTDGKETEENNKITFRRPHSLSSSDPRKQKRQSYSQPPIKNYYYTAELSVERSEVPLPCTISLIVNGVVMGRMSLLGMPMHGIARVSMPLARPLKDVAPTTDNGNGGWYGQTRRSLRKRRTEMRAAVDENTAKRKRGLGHVDMTPKRIIPFLRGNMTVEIRANDQTLTDPSTVPSLHLEIQDWEYMPRKSDSDFPVFNNPRKWSIGIRGPGGHGGYGGGH